MREAAAGLDAMTEGPSLLFQRGCTLLRGAEELFDSALELALVDFVN